MLKQEIKRKQVKISKMSLEESMSVLWLKVILFLFFNCHTDDDSFKNDLFILTSFFFISFPDL